MHGEAELIIVVDASCRDRTEDIATAAASDSSRIRVIRSLRPGKGHTLSEGVRVSRGRHVLFADVDLSVEPFHFHEMVGRLSRGVMVIANRRIPGARRVGDPILRALSGRMFNMLVRLLVLPGLTDTQCGCKAMPTALARDLLVQVEAGGWAFDVELLAIARKQGARVVEHPVTWRHKTGSRLKPWSALQAVAELLGIATRVGRIR